jgi:hypothetical protein
MLPGQEVRSYKMDVRIDVEQKKLDVRGTVLIDFEKQDSIVFYLWRNTTFKGLSNDKKEIPYTFDTINPLPLPFIINAGKLLVANPISEDKPQQINFEYSCYMQQNMVGFGKTFTDEWIETGYHAAWYPVHEGSRNFTAEVKVYADEDIQISGSGLVADQDSCWLMTQSWESFDILLVASKDLKVKRIEQGNIYMETVYATFPESDIDSIFIAFRDVLEFFNLRFGQEDGEVYFKFIIDPTEGQGGYGRKNLIRLKASSFSDYFKLGIAHELSHSWWQKADTGSWEDWLNESFAEYSMLMYLRDRMDVELYNRTLERYRQNSENMPAIWGIERTSDQAYTTLYEKGALLLIALEHKLGEEQMEIFLCLLIDKSVDNTADYLKELESFSSREIRAWFEDELKK